METSRPPGNQRDALSLLLNDHRAVETLFKQFQDAKDDAQKQSIATETCVQLTVHTKIEEDIFYPALRGVNDKLDRMLDEAKAEHAEAKELIAKIQSGDQGTLDADYNRLSGAVRHHVQEEENEMFPEVIQAQVDLDAVGEQITARKTELLGQNV